MTSDPVESAGHELFGESWKSAMARALDISITTLDRQRGRERPRGPVLAALSAWLLLDRTFGILPPETPGAGFRSRNGAAHEHSDEKIDWTDFVRDSSLRLFEGKKSKLRLAKALGLDAVSLWRQTEQSTATGPVVATIRAWLLIKMLVGTLPPEEPFAQWDATPQEPEPKRRTKSKYADLLSTSGS